MRGMWIIALIIWMPAMGCSVSSIQLQAQSARAIRTLNDDAVELVEVTCEEKSAAAASNRAVTPDRAEVDALAILETCEAIKNSQHLVAEAHGAWVAGLMKAIAEDDDDPAALMALAIAAVRLYGEVVPLAAMLDLELPEVPEFVLGLIGRD